MHQRHARHLPEQLAGKVRGAANPGRAIRHARLRSGPLDELRQRPGRHRWVHHQQVRRLGDQRDRLEILHRLVAYVLLHGRPDHMAGRAKQQRVAIVGLARHVLGRDLPGRAGTVLHHKALPERLRQLRRQQAPHDIGHAAGRECHHDGDGLAGIRVRLGQRGRGCCQGNQGNQETKGAAAQGGQARAGLDGFHGVSGLSFLCAAA